MHRTQKRIHVIWDARSEFEAYAYPCSGITMTFQPVLPNLKAHCRETL